MADKNKYDYAGEAATVTWDGALCIHIGECGRARGELFVGGRQPWCQPNAADADEIRDVIQRCPTGALSVTFADGSVPEVAASVNTVQVAYNGPLFVKGELQIDGAPADVPGLSFRAALCRCGKSKNKPFCDNSHEADGFQDYGAVGEQGSTTETSGGPLEVRFAEDGPILMNGNFEVLASSGRKAWQGTKAALCRCGASNNKPFCDGQHKKAGFKSS
jgi:CDGSH-type Zn-finger protein/uncharacterized Fe-S cluster protein YjdI